MTYVPTPIIPPTSRRARELAEEIERTIKSYQKTHPDTSTGDVQQALRLASPSSSTAKEAKLALTVGLTLAAVLGLVVLVLAMRR